MYQAELNELLEYNQTVGAVEPDNFRMAFRDLASGFLEVGFQTVVIVQATISQFPNYGRIVGDLFEVHPAWRLDWECGDSGIVFFFVDEEGNPVEPAVLASPFTDNWGSQILQDICAQCRTLWLHGCPFILLFSTEPNFGTPYAGIAVNREDGLLINVTSFHFPQLHGLHHVLHELPSPDYKQLSIWSELQDLR